MDDTVDEQGRCAADLSRRQATLDVAADAPQHAGALAVAVECGDVELELRGVAPEVVVLKRPLAVVEQVVHLPEPVLERGGLRGCGGGEGVWMDLRQGEVAEG